jgi:hypothetical protein
MQLLSDTTEGTHSGVVKFGFELTVENSMGAKVGTLQISEPTRTKLTNANKAVTHTAAGNVPSGNSNSWTMNWVAPSNVQGNVGIYAAFNAANGNGNTSGDVIYKSSTFISEYTPPPALLSINPNQADQQETFVATITGSNTNFSGTPDVRLSFSSNGFEIITSTDVVVLSPTTLQAQFAIPATASVGLWDVRVGGLVLEDSFTVLLVTGLDDLTANAIRIYPNPAQERFFLDNARGAELSVYRTNGELVSNMQITDDKQEVRINQLSPGLHLVKVHMNGITRVEKLLVN